MRGSPRNLKYHQVELMSQYLNTADVLSDYLPDSGTEGLGNMTLVQT